VKEATVGLALLRKVRKPPAPTLPFHEVVFAGFLAISPSFSVALAVFVTRFVSPRYSICAMGGIVIAIIVVMDAVAPCRRLASFALLSVSALLFGLDQHRSSFNREALKERDAQLIAPFAAVPDGVPLVVASGLALLPADMYGSARDLDRTFYLLDPSLCLKYTGLTNFEYLPKLEKYRHYRAHFADYSAFVSEFKLESRQLSLMDASQAQLAGRIVPEQRPVPDVLP
jgi:hypothetical protein